MNQQNLLANARAAGQEGMERVARNAEKNAPGWGRLALIYLARYAVNRPRGELFTIEDVSDSYRTDGCFLQAHDMRAWGSVAKKAKRLGLIEFKDALGIRRFGHGTTGANRYVSRVSGKRWTEVDLGS